MFQWLPQAASTYAKDIDGLMWLITAIVGVWFLIAEAVLFFLIFKYRKRDGRPASYVTGDKRRQIAWILIPCAAILACDLIIDGASAHVWERMKQTEPPAQLTVRIDGQQWAWICTHPGPDGKLDTPDDVIKMNELHVPVNQVVRFELRSKDTLHSLWIPELRLKQDAVPGRTIYGWFEATKTGSYGVLCAELCGAAHGMMRGTLTVDDPEPYRAWVTADAAASTPATKEAAAP
jgi:cytochrome c oxidase subunit 2